MLVSFIENLPGYEFIETFINSTIDLDGYIQKLFEFINSLDAVTLVFGSLLAALIFFIGTLELLKKLSKLIIVAGIIVLLWMLYSNNAFDTLLGG